jgi:predicted nuclease with TOPRIM domain
MPITSKLSRRLYETLGDEAADEMVGWMHGVDAQRAELRELNELNFARIDERFKRVDIRFDAVDARFDALEGRLAAVERRLDARMDGIEARMGKIEVRMDRIEAHMDTFEAKLTALAIQMEKGFAGLEAKIDQRTADIMKWSFVFWVGSVLTMTGALVALSRFLP